MLLLNTAMFFIRTENIHEEKQRNHAKKSIKFQIIRANSYIYGPALRSIGAFIDVDKWLYVEADVRLHATDCDFR